MLDEAMPLPDDPRDLRALARLLIAEVKAQAVLIEKLRHQLAGLRTHRFGTSSETAEQLQLALEASEVASAAIMGRLRLPEDGPDEDKGHPRRRPLPDHIPRMTIELAPGEEACARCGGHLRRLGEDVTEELEYVPGARHLSRTDGVRCLAIVNRIVRPRLACSGCERFVQAPLPSRPIERGRPGPGLLAHVLVAKYADHRLCCANRRRDGGPLFPGRTHPIASVTGIPREVKRFGTATLTWSSATCRSKSRAMRR